MRRFKGYIRLLAGLLMIAGQPLGAQNLNSARSLYYNGAFPAAEQAFSTLAQKAVTSDYLNRAEIESYTVLCNIAMDRINAEWSLKVYADKYPNAPQLPMLKFRLASRFFDRGEYEKAGSYFENLRESELYAEWRIEFRFKRAFCQMREDKRQEAAKGFQSVIDAPRNIYTFPSIYYLGYVKYLDRDFAAAVPLFEKASTDSRFRLMSSYYCLESRFLQNDYDYVIAAGPELYEMLPEDLKVNVSRILSESLYRKGDSQRAAEYMDRLRQSASGFSRKDQYFAGYLAYGMGLYDKALENFSQVTTIPDSLSQNAWYRKADCHLKRGNRNAALTAFGHAAEMDADSTIRQDAFFNYARLCFDVNSDFSKFEEYLKTFPGSGKEDIINGYLAASYILAKDYGSAIGVLKKIKSPTRESVSNLQKAAFLKGMQFVRDGSFGRALPLFELSEANGKYNGDLLRESAFWRAECLYRTHEYEQSAELLGNLLSNSQFADTLRRSQAQFNLAFCDLKMQKYEAAVKAFEKYLGETNPMLAATVAATMPLGKEAALRMADAYYMMGDYVSAAAAYDAARAKYQYKDLYPAFRAAMSYGVAGNTDRKIEILSKIRTGQSTSATDGQSAKTSNGQSAQQPRAAKKITPLYARSLLELGRTYEILGRSDEAQECFEDVLTLRGDSTCFSAALLDLATLYVNASDNDKALRYYKRIVEDCPLSDELQEAIAGMESIYQSMNRPDDFLAYLDRVGMSEARDESQKEKMLFNSAASLYRQGQYSKAVSGLQDYITQYQDNINTTEAYFMLGECLRETGRKEAALENYLKAMRRGGNREISEAATWAYAKLSYSMEHYPMAVSAYTTLLQMGVSEKMVSTALLGRMRAYFKNKQWDEAIADGKMLLSRAGTSPAILREAQYDMAKCLIVKGARMEAMEYFVALAKDCSDAFGAEAEYQLIYDAYNDGEFGRVEEMVYAFSDSGTEQMYWLAKSYLVLGDSFAAQGDLEKARMQYESLVQSYEPKGDDGIKTAANQRLAKMKEGQR